MGYCACFRVTACVQLLAERHKPRAVRLLRAAEAYRNTARPLDGLAGIANSIDCLSVTYR